MFKKSLSKFLVTTAMCTMLVAGSVCAASRPTFSFTLGNTGQNFTHFSSTYNKKAYTSDPWTLKVNSITYAVNSYGVRFVPVQYNSSTGKNVKICTQSGVWRSSVGYGTVAFASSDVALTNYKLAARQDDDYYSTFKASGWFNADKVSDQ
ncbi:MAG: hypothetical protein HDR01_05025 [Lachnospiraceae bacterium]|nr:hypothetical protein [Lachnospiraceae bacterium]